MSCVTDNDFVIQLAAWNLLNEFQAFLRDSLGVAEADIYVLDALPARIHKGDTKLERQYGNGALARVQRFCENKGRVRSLPSDPSLLASIASVQAIDPGEAILIATAAQTPGTYLATNEWRFLEALATHPDQCAAAHDALKGRVLHLKQFIRYLLDAKGFQALKNVVTPANGSDIIIQRAFAQNAAGARATLDEEIATLQRIAKGMLADLSLVT